jgi:protease-4
MRFITRLFAVIGFLVVLGIVLGGAAALHFRHTATPLPAKAILAMTIDGELEEKPGFDPLKLHHQMSMGEALHGLHHAATDARIKGVFLTISDNLPLAQAQELHDEILAFRKTGKTVYAFADTFGEQSAGAAEYVLAAACDKIVMQPLGTVGLVGISSDQLFVKDALARYGIGFEGSKREQYKTAFDMFTENGFTPSNREMTSSLLNDIVEQVVTTISSDRHVDQAVLRHAMDTGPIMADDAKEMNLVDEIDYRDQALDDIEDKLAVDDTISMRRYLNSIAEPATKAKIALIYAQGELSRHSGIDPLDPVADNQASDPKDVVAAFRQASEDDSVKAIVFRINSPGGSVVASETIRSGVLMANDAKKPVIVSMGEVAGSGGYWIAADADRIIAEPSTLTGSIGVLGGKPVFQKLLQDHGVVEQSIDVGQNSNMDSPFKSFTPEQSAKQNEMLDDIYDTFKALVADGRGMSPDKVDEIAKGRVYTGRQAKEIGLVDELGGLELAITRAKEAAGMNGNARISVVEVPSEPSMAELLRSVLFQGDSGDDDDALMRSRIRMSENLKALAALRPYLRALMSGGDNSVLMQPMPVKQ